MEETIDLITVKEDFENIEIYSDNTFTQLTEDFYVVSITEMEKNIKRVMEQ